MIPIKLLPKLDFVIVCLAILLCLSSTGLALDFIGIIPNEFEYYAWDDLDWDDSDDDYNSGSTALGFSVTIGGASYTHFDMNSNGYVELLTGAADTVTDYGCDYINGFIAYNPTSTYLLAAYDDLSSWDYNYYGYALEGNRAVFYYDTETYYDEGDDYLNRFEMILYNNGSVRWNFNKAEYEGYYYDLFSGLYFGNTSTLLELTRDEIPAYESYIYVPEPTSLSLLAICSLATFYRRRNSRPRPPPRK